MCYCYRMARLLAYFACLRLLAFMVMYKFLFALFCLGCLFVLIVFFAYFSIANFALFVDAGFLVRTDPLITRFSAVLACRLLVLRVWYISCVIRCLFCFLFLFGDFFSPFLCWFPLFSVFRHFYNIF